MLSMLIHLIYIATLCEVGTIINPVLRIGKPSSKEVNNSSKGIDSHPGRWPRTP